MEGKNVMIRTFSFVRRYELLFACREALNIVVYECSSGSDFDMGLMCTVSDLRKFLEWNPLDVVPVLQIHRLNTS